MKENSTTEFEWRRQLRELHQPIMPQRDLWASIEAALDGAPRSDAKNAPSLPKVSERKHRQHFHWLLTGSVAAAVVLACGIGWQVQHRPANAQTLAGNQPKHTWKRTDPRLAGAAIELDAARMELQLAMQQAPHSAALQRLLHHTEQQQTQLRQLAKQAG